MPKLALMLMLSLTLTSASAQAQRQMKVYIKGGLTDCVQVDGDAKIGHSRTDLNGTAHDDFVVMSITDAQGRNRQYLISQLDSLVMPNGRRVVFHGFTNVNVNENENQNENGSRLRSCSRSFKRTSFDGTFPGGSGVTYYWTYNDHIRLDVGYESRAKSLSSNNTEASFVFEDAELDAESYMVYFPDRDVTIPSVQTQTGANTTAHIGASGDCGTAIAERNDDGSYSFTLQHKAAYLCFLPYIDNLPSARVTKIELYCSSSIAGKYQVSEGGLYNGTSTSNTITLNLVPAAESDFIIGHDYKSEQDSTAAFMVIKPQENACNFVAAYYVTDTLSRISKVYRQQFSFKPLANTVYPIRCKIRDTEFRAVDLSLSVNWLNRNIGSIEPSARGNSFANDSEANVALLAETVVTTCLMPTEEQQQELLEKCIWTWGVFNGKTGYLVEAPTASGTDGNRHRIFLPSASQVTPAECLSTNWRPVEALLIDLGLPSGTKWASRNIGALSAEDYGDFFAWGESQPKDTYTNGNSYGSQNLGNGADDLDNSCDIGYTQHDAAFVNWGGAWRMPTKRQLEELSDAELCDWTWTPVNGVNGYVVTGPNGNRIFLPAAGVKEGTNHSNKGSAASYPSSQCSNNDSYAWMLTFHSTNWGVVNTYYTSIHHYNDLAARRYYGRPVRAVVPSLETTSDGMALTIITDSSTWRLGREETTLHGTLRNLTPIKGEVTVGFVIGDTANITLNKSRYEYRETVSSGGHFTYTLPVYDNIGYWYRAFVQTSDTIMYGEPKTYGYVMVDLGLPTKTLWASMNLGAETPEGYGNYYSWGETWEKSGYSNTTASYPYGSSNLGENLDIAGTEHDVAHVLMGNAWRMPTKLQMEELLNNEYCRWEWTTQNSVNGYLITSRFNGNTIFLPAAGMKDSQLRNSGTCGSYMTSLQAGNDNSYLWSLVWNTTTKGVYNAYYTEPLSYNDLAAARWVGHTVRPVATLGTISEDGLAVTILTDSATWKLNDTSATIYGTLSSTTPLPEQGIRVGFVVGDSASITLADDRPELRFIKTVTAKEHFSATVSVYENFGYWYRAFVDTGDTVFYGKAKHFGWEMVDLGLPSGTLWANMNVGASWPEEYGNYFAWGETEEKGTYTRDNYNYYNHSLNRYENLGDDYHIEFWNYDAAYVNMGHSWCMPTDDDFNELLTCQWERYTQNNVKGILFTGPNGHTLFLPSAGRKNGSSLEGAKTEATYFGSVQSGKHSAYGLTLAWSSNSAPGTANAYYSEPFSYNDCAAHRWYGRPVRAVFKPNAVGKDRRMMHLVTVQPTWRLNETTATVKAAFSSTSDFSSGIVVGILIGDSANMRKGEESVRYNQEHVLTAKDTISKSVPVVGNMGYWYRSYVEYGDTVIYGEARHIGWEMVDLGLPSGTKWANMNVGASNPEDYGNYYAWGELIPKDTYTTDNYIHLVEGVYQDLGVNGHIEKTNFDVAYIKMNSHWCMPTNDQLDELCSSLCTWNPVVVNGINGFRVIGPNKKSIFLPSAGMRNGGNVEDVTSQGSFFGSVQNTSEKRYAWMMGWNSNGSYGTGNAYYTSPFGYDDRASIRWYGRSVRAVASGL